MLKTLLSALISIFLVSTSSDKTLVQRQQESPENQTGTLEKMIVANGSVAMEVDLNRLNGGNAQSQWSTLNFAAAPNSFFTILVFNGDLRGAERGSLGLVPQNSALLPAALSASFNQLVIERTDWTEPFELIVRDGQTGFTFFNIEGNVYNYDAKTQLLSVKEGRLLISKEFAAKLGRRFEEGAVVGTISVDVNMRAIEITQVVNGQPRSSVMPPSGVLAGTVPGPDVIVGDLSGLAQFGSSSGTQVGLAVATDSCNAGVVPLNWLALPNNDHPVIPQNLYRMSGGATNDDRFEQIGQSNVKHAFTALQQNICGFGCSSTASTTLGSGCSDPYSASLNAGSNNALGSRAWINPFTGAYPRGDSATPPNTHTGHTHTGPSHRILVEMSDLNTSLNAGATYYAEAQYVTPHEYAWCVAHPGECNMYNNASNRRFNVTGTASPFSFTAVGSTVRSRSAITNWPGATINRIEPDPGNDGIGYVAYKVTNPSPGVWHYEYAVYNQNLDRAIQSFSVPSGGTLSNIGFHAPPQHPAWSADGTVGNAGYSSTPWTPTQASNALTWTSETFAQNPNANAIRWGTLYNFRFDSDRPPQITNATVGFLKTGAPILVQIQGPNQAPSISINDVAVTEGNSGTKLATFTVSLSSASTDTVTVQYATANGTATAGSDYVAASGTVTFSPSVISQPVSITVNGDTLEEFNETYFVNLSAATNATIADSQGLGTITNDETPLATLASGFAESQINGLSSPTSMAIHPDGRIFVCEQGGALRVIKNGAVLSTPFTTLTVNSSGERGLLGIAFDPNYASNRFIYVYYTATSPATHNRVSRFTADIANEDVAVAESELAILDLDNLSGATNHNGGAIHFGPDGKLYVAVGENANSANAQSLANRLGKMLRINSDGTIPADNPTTFPNIAGSPTGNNRAIWAVGLRNPYTFSFQPGTGRMHINDVGQNTWEEIDLGTAGANYGWPTCEGSFLQGSQSQPCATAGMTNPIYQYSSATASECAITGGAFYNPTTPTFPAEYIGKYFLADYCGGWLKSIDPLNPPATGGASSFATGISSPVDIQVANDGSLYYLARGTNSVFRVQYFGGSTLAVNDVTITEGNTGTSAANFTVFLSPASSQTVTVQYATANNTALSGSDYLAVSGTATFAPGETSKPVGVTVNGDTQFEPNETFNVNLTNPTNATIGDSQGVGTIINDDGQPAISINDVAVAEGNTGTTTAAFTVSLANASSQTITVNYATAGDTATSGTDFVATSGTATITPGLLSTTVNVTVGGDTTFEGNESFFVNLTSPTNATISDNQGVGTINNDDGQPTISINDVSVTEGNAGTINAGFTVSLSNPSSQTITLNYATADGSAAANGDYVTASGTVTFTPGLLTQPISVTVNGDTTFETNETFNVNLSGEANATISDNQGVGTINNDDAQPTISINDVSVTEGNAGTINAGFTVSLSNPSSQTISVNYATADDTATAGSDYATAGGTLTFTPGQTSQPINVAVGGDTTFEPNETFNVNLSGEANATITDNQGVGTINNDDAQPTISINDVSVTEGNARTTNAGFTVSLSNPSSQTITVNYATADSSAAAGSDYVTASGTVTFTPGQVTQPISVTVNGDITFEPSETFNVNLSGEANATVSDNQGVGTISNDDAQPTISINDVSVSEGNAGTTSAGFTVSLSNPSSQTITVNYATADNIATAGSDYVTASGTVTFTPGQTSQPVGVTVNGDTTFEPNESFNVNLSGEANATISDNQGVGTINNDDVQPTISINDVSVTEGNTGTSAAGFTVSLSNSSYQSITVNYATVDNTATAGSDYVTASGTVTFTPGQLTQPISVTVNGDTTFEPNENFNVNLSIVTNATIGDNQAVGTISNDDAQPTISINDVSVTEGNTGTTSAGFTVSLSNPSYQTITVNYATADNTATAGSDYVAASGMVTFAAGQLTQPIRVTVNGDLLNEPAETFSVDLSAATNASIADNQGLGTITNDDAQPTISINDVSVTEGNTGTIAATFTLSLSNASGQTITVNYATADGSAMAGSDYVATSGTVTFTPAVLIQSISVTVNGDTTLEPNEAFNVNLSGATNATFADSVGLGTITNDDAQPTISINDVSVSEGNAGTTNAGFTVSLSNANSQTITVNYATANGTATAGTDYLAASGTVTFMPGQTSQPLNVTVNSDLLNEADVTFKVDLSAATNATIADNQGIGTILDDDAPILATEQNSQRALALDAVTFVRDPFAITNSHYFGADKRTRIILFATNLSLTPGPLVTAQAVDSQQMNYQLPVEFVSSLPAFLGFTEVIVKLPDGIVNVGDLQVSITVRGRTSNSVLVGVTP
jgi:glucose/arabinose dehydrogenase